MRAAMLPGPAARAQVARRSAREVGPPWSRRGPCPLRRAAYRLRGGFQEPSSVGLPPAAWAAP
jgi:hypothetical protein